MTEHVRHLVAGVELSRGVQDFMTFAKTLAVCKGHVPDAQLYAGESGASERVQKALKAVSAATTTSDISLAGGTDYAQLARAFLESLRPFSSFDRIAASGFTPVAPNTIIGSVSSGIAGHEQGENVIKLIDSLDIGVQNFENMQKTSAILVASEDVLRSANAAAGRLIERELKKAVAVGSDRLMFAVLLDGSGVAVDTAAGTDAAALVLAVEWLLANVDFGALSSLYFIADPVAARHLATARDEGGRVFPEATIFGGSILGIPLLVSSGAASGSLTLVVADSVGAAVGPVVVSSARHATLQLVDDADDLGSAPHRSLWQRDERALRVERWIGLQVLRSGAIAQVTGIEGASA